MALTQILTTDSVSASLVNTKIVDKTNEFITKMTVPIYVTITTNWIGITPPYTQEVAVTGITADDEPRVYPVYSNTSETALLEKEAISMVTYWDTGAGTITFTCLEDKPIIAIPIAIKGA